MCVNFSIFIIQPRMYNINTFYKKVDTKLTFLLNNPKTINFFLCAIPNINTSSVNTSSEMPVNPDNYNIIFVLFCYLFNSFVFFCKLNSVSKRVFKQMVITADAKCIAIVFFCCHLQQFANCFVRNATCKRYCSRHTVLLNAFCRVDIVIIKISHLVLRLLCSKDIIFLQVYHQSLCHEGMLLPSQRNIQAYLHHTF